MSDDTINRLLSRKFILALVSVLSATLLVLIDKIEGGVYSTVVLAVVGGYMAANVTQKAVVKEPA